MSSVGKSRFTVFLLIFLIINLHYAPMSNTSSTLTMWANDGGDKVTQDDLRASNGGSVLNSIWDGNSVSLFGARNEVVSFNLIIEADKEDVSNVEITFNTLTGPNGATITSREITDDDYFNFIGRNIELFYVRYLEIKGISTDLAYAGYNYDQRHLPERFQLPYHGEPVGDMGPYEGIGDWEDRLDHNQFYPDILVPIELETPFTVPEGNSQSVWCDIYIPKTTPPGIYEGTVHVESDTGSAMVPITLEVHDFMLPDYPSAKTMLYLQVEDMNYRYMGEDYPDIDDIPSNYVTHINMVYNHATLIHRHKISIIDGYTYAYAPESSVDAVVGPKLPILTGELFTPSFDYDGIGVGVGNNVYSIGTYGDWHWNRGTEQDMWDNTDAWVEWFEEQEFQTPTDYFLYLIDESDDHPRIEEWSQMIKNNPGPGKRLQSMATIWLPDALKNTPTLDIPTSAGSFGITHLWDDSTAEHNEKGKEFWLYNGQRPATGTFATEDDGVSPRVIAWTQYKMDVDRWFYWDATYYHNYQGGMGYTDLLNEAMTYGSYDRNHTSLGRTGWNYFNGDGVLVYPGTDLRFTDDNYGMDGPIASVRLKNWRRGIQDVDYLTMAAEVDPIRTAELVEEMIPIVLWEVGVEGEDDPSWVYSDISWSTDPDNWEAARRELASIINSADTDNDGTPNNLDTDDDNDGIPDIWEIIHGLNPIYAADATADPDDDSIINLEEFSSDTDPTPEPEYTPIVIHPPGEEEYEQEQSTDTETSEEPEPGPSTDITTPGEPEQETLCEITIQVYNLDNEPVNGVTVSSTSQPSGESTLTTTSGSDGRAIFSEVNDGNYVFRVMKQGYESTTVSGGVEEGETLMLTAYLEESESEESSGGGIPGFPNVSIILGLIVLIIIMNRGYVFEPQKSL